MSAKYKILVEKSDRFVGKIQINYYLKNIIWELKLELQIAQDLVYLAAYKMTKLIYFLLFYVLKAKISNGNFI